MTTLRHRGAIALTAAAALAIGVIPAALTTSSILASGEGTTTLESAAEPVELDSHLTLTSDGTTGTVAWNGITETFTGGQQCEIAWAAGAPTLLDLTARMADGDSALAGFRDGQIGVFEPSADGSPTNASQCFRVDSDSFDLTEVLTVGLGSNPALVEQFGTTESPILIGQALLTYSITTKTGGFKVMGAGPQGEVDLGTVTWGVKKVNPGTILSATLAIPADTYISSFSLTPTQGSSFSLRTADLTLYSNRDATFCNPQNPNTPDGGKSSHTDGVTTVNYLGNADESNSCFGVKLIGGDREYTWLKPLTVSKDAQFTFIQNWTLPTPSSPTTPLPPAFIDFELEYPAEDPDGQPIPSGPHEMLFCPEDLYNASGDLGLVTDEDTLALLAAKDMELDDPDVPGSAGTQFACIDKYYRTTNIERGDNGLKVGDRIFLIGDAKMSM